MHEAGLARSMPHTPGFTDALGTRQLVFDTATSTSLEVLRFKPEFSESPDFEGALLARVEALSHVKHASLGTVQSVERVSDAELALISRHTPGRRVSELLPKAHGPAFALELIRLVTPALATLQRSGEEVAHGALSAERIVVTRDGRLVVVEHVVGAAIEALRLPRQRLIELGLIVPATPDPVQFTSRSDMAQLGFIALALLLGRKLDTADYPDRVPALLDEFSRTAGSPMLAAKLRSWLERAMQLSPRSFASAKDAQAAFGDLPDDTDVQAAAVMTGLDAFPQEATKPPVPAATTASPTPASSARVEPEPAVIDRRGPVEDRRAPTGGRRWGVWVAAALGVVAVAEGVALFVMPNLRPATEQIEVRPPQNLTASLQAPPLAAAPAIGDAAAATTTPTPTPSPTPAATQAAQVGGAAAGSALVAGVTPAQTPAATPAPGAVGTFGGMTVSAPIELQVFEDGKLIGSTTGPIAIGAGARAVEFVNEPTGFRYRQTVNVRGGQMTTVKIAVPNGRVSINAAPWAEVDVDGTPAGETPIANLSLPIGTHEVTFRHPQLGTKKQTIVVKVEGITKVTQVFQE